MDSSFNQKKIEEEVTDTGIQKILLRHLQQNGNNPDIAFSPDGVERMNQNMTILNNGKWHQPIYKVRTYEKQISLQLVRAVIKLKSLWKLLKEPICFCCV